MRASVALLCLCCALAALEQQQLQQAWQEGRVADVELLLGRPDDAHDDRRLWLARCRQFDDPKQGLQLLCDGPWSLAARAAWPQAVRGFWSMVAAELHLATGNGDFGEVRGLLLDAIESGGRGVEVDRCLLMLVEAFEGEGRRDEALRCAQTLWHSWQTSIYRPQAGLFLAHHLLASDPDRAGAVLHALLVHPRLRSDEAMQARELLCRLLIADDPGQVRRIAEKAADETPGDERWRYWLARSHYEFGDEAAVEELRALSAACRERYRVETLFDRVETGPQQARQAAAAAQAAGRIDEARDLLAPHIERDEACLRDWLALPGSDASTLETGALLLRPDLLLPVAAAISRRDRPAAVSLLEQGLDRCGLADPRAPELLQALEYLLRDGDPLVYASLLERIRSCPQVHAVIGEAWCRLAQESTGGASREAWEHAARSLPVDHPWSSRVVAQAARARWQRWRQEGRPADLAAVEALAERIAWRGDEEAHRRCRFLLAEVAVERDDPARARMLVAALRPHADERQARLLDQLMARLRRRTESP